VSKFLLNLLVEILKVLPNSKIYLNSKIKTLFIFLPFISRAGPFGILAHLAPPTSLFLLHCADPLLLGLPPPFARPDRPIHPWRISGNMFSLSEGACHKTCRPSSSSSHTEAKRASRRWQPASCRPHGHPTTSAEEEKTPRHLLLHSPIKRRPPLFNTPVTDVFKPRH
jgi:hypothetical protein